MYGNTLLSIEQFSWPLSMRNLVSVRCPHQPSSLGMSLCAWRSCMKMPAIAPALAFKYYISTTSPVYSCLPTCRLTTNNTMRSVLLKSCLKASTIIQYRLYQINPFYNDVCNCNFILVLYPWFLWPPYVTGRPLYFCPVVSFYLLLLLSSFFYSSPNLSGRRLDVYHTTKHGVALVRI